MKSFVVKLIMCVAVLITATPALLRAEVTPTDVSKLSYVLYATATKATAGEEVELKVYMKNAKAITSWQFDMVLPEGVTIAIDEFGDSKASVSGTRTSSSRHSVSTQPVSNGAIRVLCGSQTNKTFIGTDGEVATIVLQVAESATTGDNAIVFNSEVMVETNETPHKVATVTNILTIEAQEDPAMYDLNKDGKVSIADVAKLVEFIKTHPELDEP